MASNNPSGTFGRTLRRSARLRRIEWPLWPIGATGVKIIFCTAPGTPGKDLNRGRGVAPEGGARRLGDKGPPVSGLGGFGWEATPRKLGKERSWAGILAPKPEAWERVVTWTWRTLGAVPGHSAGVPGTPPRRPLEGRRLTPGREAGLCTLGIFGRECPGN